MLLSAAWLNACGGDGGGGMYVDDTDPPGAPPGPSSRSDDPPIVEGPSGDVRTPLGGTVGSETATLSDQQFADQFSAPSNRRAAATNTIAYIQTEAGRQSIRLIDVEGRDDREILAVSGRPSIEGAPSTLYDRIIFDGLAWRPDGTELSFSSNFEVTTSRAEIYAVTSDGTNLRRLTAVPRPIAYRNYPQGTVDLTVLHPSTSGGVSIGYLQGAQQAWGWLGSSQERRTIRFSVADFGPGIVQQAVLLNDNFCYYDAAANVDVVADQHTVVRQVLPPTTITFDRQCPYHYSAQWIDNERIAFVRRHLDEQATALDYSPAFALVTAPVEALSPTTRTSELARYLRFDRVGNTFVEMVEGGGREFLFLRLDPNPASDSFLAVMQVNSILKAEEDKLFLGQLADPASGRLTRLAICPDQPDCSLADARWIPDQRAFVYSANDGTDRARLRLHALEGDDLTLVEVADGQLGKLAVSPDGSRIVVERRSGGSDVTELWMYTRADSRFSQFVDNGASPAWR